MTSSQESLSRTPPRLAAWIDGRIESLYPGYFALVMATGIISNTLRLQGHLLLSDALFAGNALAFPWLLALTVLRALRHPRALWADIINPRLVFAFFTIVAATDVFGVGLHLRGASTAALWSWLAALVTWFVLIYFSFGVLTFLNTAQGANVVHGGWLIAIVGTESLVILGALVAPSAGELAPSVFVLIHMLWGVGLGLYAIFVTLFAYRIFFFDVGPDDITPLLWVVMGAAAISTNAGSMLILTDSGMPFLAAMRPFIDGMTLIVWAWGTWWIPMLLLFGIWKHVICRVPLTYTPMLWSLVFPLGMYSLASLRLSLAADFPPLHSLAQAMAWIALAAWGATLGGLAAAVWAGPAPHPLREAVTRPCGRRAPWSPHISW
ncbi:C4-dicarboxylate transporter/malic acid transport protein [Rubellimicrobium mesophilum DSM 19309]|uniref:C4-dicarboxylate transporter/malic acid transport protein n=1 Tax=Rubellimicrobium mesophilum DSM 19309 TaxID=442562 RepID=A0A017HMY4_9RHOB|nr:tellurite resistance/C4-dicarboxylate transporter family protein [Rubellimicrobium mesophilum]EYD75508.1 C4-dicarboxylate transporter/malic acid transport protein [Rubellimicrobium mesophilum DSM 19309]